MISLKEIFLSEAGEEGGANPMQKKVKKKPQPQAQPQQQMPKVQKDPTFLKQVQKGLNNQGPASQDDADFLKATQQGLNKVAAQQPQPIQSKEKGVPSLAQLAKAAQKGEKEPVDPTLAGLPKFKDEPEEEPFGNPDFSDEPRMMYRNDQDNDKVQQDPDFLKAIQKGLSNLKPGAPVGDQPEPKPLANHQPDEKIPSLAQLAKGAEEPEDPALAGLPKFDEPQQSDDDAFGNPDFTMPQQTDPSVFQTIPQKTTSAVKKTVGQAAAGVRNAIKNFGQDRGTNPSPAMAKTNNPNDTDGLPSTWNSPSGEPPDPGSQPGDSNDMPTLRSLSKQRFGKDVFKDTSSKWRVGDIVRVGTLDGFKVHRKDPNGWVLSRKGQNYKFIPHGGLFKV